MATVKGGRLVSGLEGNQTVVYAVIEIPLPSVQFGATFRPEN